MTTPTSPTLEMERAIACLALEVPGEVWEDVRDKWHAARDALAGRIAEQDEVIEAHHAGFVSIHQIASDLLAAIPSMAGDELALVTHANLSRIVGLSRTK